MFVPCEEEKNDNFDGFTLILPAVAVGNVGQLAIDVLIYNVPLKKIGYLYDSCILPVVGNDPFTKSNEDEGNLVTSVEVYKSEQKKLVVVQQRAPVKKGCRQIYCDRIIQWIKECQFKQTILLTSCLASERLDSQIQSEPFRFVVTSTAEHLTETFQSKLGWKYLEKRKELSTGKDNSNDIFLPGGGVSKQLYQTCCKKDVPLVMLLVFCAEGDNIPDAMTMLYYTNTWLQLLEDKKNVATKDQQTSKVHWKQPPSWKNLYGTKRLSSLF